MWQLLQWFRPHPLQLLLCETPRKRKIVQVELVEECVLRLESRWQLTSETMSLSSMLSFVRLAVLLNTLLMPISGRRVCSGYDCSILNFGKATSSLLHMKDAIQTHLLIQFVCKRKMEKKMHEKVAVSQRVNRNEHTHIFRRRLIHPRNLLAVISSSMTV